MQKQNLVVFVGGVGGARFTRGLVAELERRHPSPAERPNVTAIVNTGDDAWIAGLRVTPDLDSMMYTLAGVNDEQRGWGRAGESERVSAELAAYGVGWPWFTLGDLDLGTHIARTAMLREGLSLTSAVERLTARWNDGAGLPVRLLPMTDSEVETHVEVDRGEGPELIHFEEWWVRYRAALPTTRFEQVGLQGASTTWQVREAIEQADALLLAPSNPVVSIGTILAVPGVREALAAASAPVIGVSPIIAGRVVRGMADACLSAIGVETSSAAVAEFYGARRRRNGILDGWLVAEEDADAVSRVEALGIRTRAVPLWMKDAASSAALAGAALDFAAEF
ncbi:2-phospho-L-lactate transferase [Gryllotalpicola ginsengisoli]|uniref:2-phospho-L-lactate transferase n=1 Tax=Gryllotalpicola ginsengisoli TaxID=444608 RepID=UPI0003B5533B|nr:2-phospho-L-lactate transferase [Gryllotalpicola ginsengisoli]